MKTSLEMDKIVEALSIAQGQFKPLIKNKKANYGKYADLSAVMDSITDALHVQGLCVSQSPEFIDGRLIVTTRLFHKSGQWIENQVSLKPGQDTAQGMGSVITYGRRYGMTALLGICADDDDDGQSAQPQVEQKKAYPPREVPKPAPAQAPARVINEEVFNHEDQEHRRLISSIMVSLEIPRDDQVTMGPTFRGKKIKDIITYIDSWKKEEPMITFNN